MEQMRKNTEQTKERKIKVRFRLDKRYSGNYISNASMIYPETAEVICVREYNEGEFNNIIQENKSIVLDQVLYRITEMWSYEADKNFCVFAGKEPQNFMPV
jgi:hypothetical protein